MRRLVGPGLGLLLGGVVAMPAAAQRSAEQPPIVLEEPRPNPVFPAALVPFAIGTILCRQGHEPRVTLRVYDVFAQPVASLQLRDRRGSLLSGAPLRCGQYVARWDGTVEGGARAASPGVYYLRLSVDSLATARKVIITRP